MIHNQLHMNYRIAISSGDFNGIGPEVILKALSELDLNAVTPVILGTSTVFDEYIDRLNLEVSYHHAQTIDKVRDGVVNILESYQGETPQVNPGTLSKQSGKCAMLAVKKGIDLCTEHKADALVTAPISKEAISLAGYNVPGHTEFLAAQTNTDDHMMMLVNEGLRVGLASVHVPVKEIVDQLSKDSVAKYIRIMQKTLQHDFSLTRPKIAVLGLNPHAGDGGIIGTEEMEFIAPAMEKARVNEIDLRGPFPADGFFGNQTYKKFDGILAMFHDQGLIPFKTLSFGAGVNFTAGLPIIRTSPDHGTAYNIAGQNKADPSSFIAAFTLATELVKNKKSKSPSNAS